MENLPNDILENILFQLPFHVMLQARSVCTTWKSLLRNYRFDKPGYLILLGKFGNDEHGQIFYGEYYDHADTNYYRFRDTLARTEPRRYRMKILDKDFLVGSCNGLVCFRKRDEGDGGLDSFEICNPLTGEYVLLPKFISPLRDNGNVYHQVGSGFGYCHSTKKYKVVTIYKQQQDDDEGHVQVYTVGGKWKYITSIPCRSFEGSSGVYANGALHWLHFVTNNSPELEILAINMKYDKSYSVPLPEDASDCYGYASFRLLGERNILYLVNNCMEIWRANKKTSCSNMKRSNQEQNYDDIESWSWINESSIYQISRPESIPFGIPSKNEVLFWYKHQIFYCNPHTPDIKKLWDSPSYSYSEAIPHTHSSISLRDLGETEVRSYKATTRPTIEKRTVKDGGEDP